MLLSRRIRLRPSPAQRVSLARAAGCARWAYNWGLRRKKAAWESRKDATEVGTSMADAPKVPSAIDLHRELNQLKDTPVDSGGVPWMRESSKCAPQEALRDLDGAFTGFFRRCKAGERPGFPRFKAKRQGEGHFRLTGTIRVEGTHIQLPRLGRVRIAPGDRGYAADGAYASVSLVQEHGAWFASVRVEVPEAPGIDPDVLPEVGIDLGVRKLAVLATPDGSVEVVPNRRALLRHARKLRAAQKVVSRRKKGSGRRRRTVRTVGRIHRRIANTRKDALHKATTAIASRFRVVAIEDLRVANMTRKGRGKRGLNRVMADASLGEFRRQLTYKLQRAGGRLVVVDPAYTSRRCSVCGAFTDCGSGETFTCAACGSVVDRDANAARNILALSRGEVDAASWPESLNARGEVVSRPSLRALAHASMKRESTAVEQLCLFTTAWSNG